MLFTSKDKKVTNAAAKEEKSRAKQGEKLPYKSESLLFKKENLNLFFFFPRCTRFCLRSELFLQLAASHTEKAIYPSPRGFTSKAMKRCFLQHRKKHRDFPNYCKTITLHSFKKKINSKHCHC